MMNERVNLILILTSETIFNVYDERFHTRDSRIKTPKYQAFILITFSPIHLPPSFHQILVSYIHENCICSSFKYNDNTVQICCSVRFGVQQGSLFSEYFLLIISNFLSLPPPACLSQSRLVVAGVPQDPLSLRFFS